MNMVLFSLITILPIMIKRYARQRGVVEYVFLYVMELWHQRAHR